MFSSPHPLVWLKHDFFTNTILISHINVSVYFCVINTALHELNVYSNEVTNQTRKLLQFLPTPTLIMLWQGLSYRAQLCPVTVTKIWTPIHPKNPLLTTLWFQTNCKLGKQLIENKTSLKKAHFAYNFFSSLKFAQLSWPNLL